ncbi:MAG TPA: hypothetical protein VIZ22_03150 [Candidatus Limnocylindrales bacterium]
MTTPDPIEPPPASPPPPDPVPPGPAGPTSYGPTAYGSTPARPSMSRPTPAGLVFGIMLVVAGSVILVSRVTDLAPPGASSWPLWLIVPGVAMVIGSFAIPPRGGLGLAIPGAILAMVGVVLWFQAAYNLYATWAYAWALVAPTGPGLGMLFYGLARGDRELARDGLRTTVTGLALFVGFALFFEGVLGLSGQTFPDVRENLPYLAIGLGGVLVVLSLFTGRKPSEA